MQNTAVKPSKHPAQTLTRPRALTGWGYLTKLLTNEAVKIYVGRHEPEILTHLDRVVNTVSME